jgi:DNA-directed RNA polymerase specialized sigma24 family protein
VWRVRKRITREFNSRVRTGEEVLAGLPPTPAQPRPDQHALDRETLESVLAELSTEQLTLVSLLAQGLNQREIAEKVGWSQVKVSRRLQDVRSRIAPLRH